MSDRDPPNHDLEKFKPGIPGKESLRAPLSKRFYKAAAANPAGNGFTVALDGRPLKTPGKRDFVVPSKALAEAIAAEWSAQREVIDPATMPLTRIANSAIDAVALNMGAVAEDVAAFACSDLLCYRAEAPRELARHQAAAWDPLLRWAMSTFEIHFKIVNGVVPVEQSPFIRQRIVAALEAMDPFALAAIHVMTTLTGSSVLALAHAKGQIGLEAAWAAAHIDEDWQIEHWGQDFEAEERRQVRAAEFAAASRLYSLISISAGHRLTEL